MQKKKSTDCFTEKHPTELSENPFSDFISSRKGMVKSIFKR